MRIADLFKDGIQNSIAAKESIDLTQLGFVAQKLVATLKQGNKLLLAGNGGSAADAQHIAAEFTGRFVADRQPLPALALTTDASALTAISNDYSFSDVFVRQLQALGQPGDMFIAISTSGDSENLIKAVDVAKKQGMVTVGLTGKTGGALRQVVDLSLHVTHSDTPRIQESHILMLHLLCAWVDHELIPA